MRRPPRRAHRAAAGASLLALALGCGGGSDPTGAPTGATSGTASGQVAAGAASSFAFEVGRSGTTHVAVCAAAGVDVTLAVGAARSASGANCERVTFTGTAGARYTAEVAAAGGSGPFNLCWNQAAAPCTAPVPGGAGTGGEPAGYYAAAEGLAGAALLAALHEIVREHRAFDYTTARDSLYAVVDDFDDDDVLEELYTGRRAAGVSTRAGAAAADLNTEHLWPRSRGAEIEYDAGTDLHHLLTADETANGQRSNHPFGEVAGTVLWLGPLTPDGTERSRLGYAADGRVVFEPRPSRRGDVARALLYFHVRYSAERTPTFSLANFNAEEATLLRWAQADPPDDAERRRHERVYRVQRNRNPFIDRPELLAAIGDFPNE
jgi:endonuclease I